MQIQLDHDLTAQKLQQKLSLEFQEKELILAKKQLQLELEMKKFSEQRMMSDSQIKVQTQTAQPNSVALAPVPIAPIDRNLSLKYDDSTVTSSSLLEKTKPIPLIPKDIDPLTGRPYNCLEMFSSEDEIEQDNQTKNDQQPPTKTRKSLYDDSAPRDPNSTPAIPLNKNVNLICKNKNYDKHIGYCFKNRFTKPLQHVGYYVTAYFNYDGQVKYKKLIKSLVLFSTPFFKINNDITFSSNTIAFPRRLNHFAICECFNYLHGLPFKNLLNDLTFTDPLHWVQVFEKKIMSRENNVTKKYHNNQLFPSRTLGRRHLRLRLLLQLQSNLQ